MKVKELSLLIVDQDQTMRQLLASIVSDRYRAVTAVAPENIGSLIGVESFDMMISPRIGINFSAGDAGDFKGRRRHRVSRAYTIGRDWKDIRLQGDKSGGVKLRD